MLSLDEFESAVHRTDDLEVLRTASKVVRSGTLQDEFRLILPSGTVRWMRSHWRFEISDGPPKRATGAMIDLTDERNMLVQSQDARAAAEASARAAREAERLEQDRKTILELVAKDRASRSDHRKDGRVAVASHLPGSLCSIRIELTGSNISVFPQFPEHLAGALDHIAIASIRGNPGLGACRQTLQRPGAGSSSSKTAPDLPFQYYRAVPILRNSRSTGLIVSHSSRG